VTATKPPPKFVTNHAAWEYTLAKLDGKGKLTADGNPQNYAAASAIYKAVVAKYGDTLMLELPEVDNRRPFVRRDQALAMEANVWRVAHNAAWSVGVDGAYQRLYFRSVMHVARDSGREVLEPLHRFEVERHGDDGVTTHTIDYDLAQWLVRGSTPATLFVTACLIAADAEIATALAETKALEKGGVVGNIGEHRFDPAYFDAERTRQMLDTAAREIDDAIEHGGAPDPA
jgi:hypothetical protein